MMRSVRTCAALLLILLASLLSGCVSGPQQQATGNCADRPKKTGPVKIGFSMDTLKEERWQRDKELVEKRAKEVGAELSVLVANGDDAAQINQAESMLTQGAEVLIVAPHNGVVAAKIVESAKKQCVPVIS